ncbi:MAG: hypothetical protein D6732_28110 [Methanobacteriota archaeon]|nr:MAG: hypothetical protein D6732_28110 [Euryarchaeota archaeon]
MNNSGSLRFHFSTTGIRGNVSKDLTPQFCFEAGRAIANWAKTHMIENPKVLIGRDYRFSSDLILSSLLSGLLAEGLNVNIIEDQAPTPAIIQYLLEKSYDIAIIVTGSHLPPEDNGIILVDGKGNYFRGILESMPESGNVSWSEFGSFGLVHDYLSTYLSHLREFASQLQLTKQDLRIFLDPVGGPMAKPLSKILQEYVEDVVGINLDPNPKIDFRPSEPKPETLVKTLDYFKGGIFDLGITTDFDGDRVIFITPSGRILTGDYIGAVIAKYFWELDSSSKVVIPINTSAIISDLSKKMNTKFVYCQVGAPKIIEKMKETDAIFGFEETGKYFFRDFCLYPDSAVTSLFLLHILQQTGQTLDDLIQELPTYFQLKTKTPSARETSDVLMKRLELDLDDLVSSLGDGVEIIQIHKLDGLRIDFSDGSWLLLRQSGTEDNLRVFSESKSEEIAKMLNDKGLAYVKQKQKELKLL